MSARYSSLFCISKYYECREKRFFTMANLQENEELFKKNIIKNSDVFIVLLTWSHPLSWFIEAKSILDKYNLNIQNFHILCNTTTQLNDAIKIGFNAKLINRHFNLDYNYYRIENVKKEYKACVFGEQIERNRIPLTFKIDNLVIVDGLNKWNDKWDYPSHVIKKGTIGGTNDYEIQKTMRKSYCGVCVSQLESMCWSSIEFLYNGIPLISTRDDTGRQEWLDYSNCVFVDDVNEDKIKEVVNSTVLAIKDSVFDANAIRESTIERSNKYRTKFIDYFGDLIENKKKSEELFKEKYEQRMFYERHWKSLDSTMKLFL